MKKYKNKYRIPSTRLSNWDYGSAALYFITICTHNRHCWFGNIVKNQCIASSQNMQLSEIGKIVELEWLNTFELRQDMNLNIGEFVVMPNHFHAIIGIGENSYNTQRTDAMQGTDAMQDTDAMQGTDAMHCVSITNKPKNKFGPQSKNLASIIRGFKSAVTIAARKIYPDFQWQSRFHDHIIRNDGSFQRITNYIINNPINWKEDSFYGIK